MSVQDVVARMTHAEREHAYATATSDGDTRRADEIAFAPVPNEWATAKKAIWRERQALAEIRLRAREARFRLGGNGNQC